MGFFSDVDELGIVERHIQGVLKLEESSSKLMLKRYKEIRQELRDRLEFTRANTFTAQQLRGVLAQVEGAISAMNSSLKGEMADASKEAALQGVEDLLSEIKRFSSNFEGAVVPININAITVAEDASNFLLNQHDASLDAYGQDLISQLTNSLTNAALQELPYSQVVSRLGQFFLGEEWKLHRIARTELHNIYNIGKLRGMEETKETAIPDLKKTLMHPMDARTGDDSKYAARLHLIANIDEPFRYKWDGKVREFMAPPDRPNDRSILVPYREEWGTL